MSWFSWDKKPAIPPVKVLVTFKHPKAENPLACHEGLGVTATHLTLSLKELRLDVTCLPILHGEYLWKKLSTDWSHFTHVIFCAPFIDSVFLGRLFNAFPNVHFALVYHSNLGFLSVDRFAMRSLKPYFDLEDICPNFRVATNSLSFSHGLERATGREFLYLPNMIHMPHEIQRKRPHWENGKYPLHVGLFGASRVLKNWLTATAATMILSKEFNTEVHFHVSTNRDEGAGATRDNLIDLLSLNPGIKLVEVPWLSHDDFVRYLYGIDLLMQPSFTETFNNVTAEGIAAGVPSVVSEAITWVPDSWKAKADDPGSVADVGIHLLQTPSEAKKGWKYLDRFNQNSEKVWLDYLNK